MNAPHIRIAVLAIVIGVVGKARAFAAEPPVVVEVFAAGSLRGVVGDLAAAARTSLHVELQGIFGGSGSLRERVEKGERPDLLLSADLASPRQLAAAGLTVVPAVPFARNRMCVVSWREAGVNASNLIDQLLAPAVRVRTSTPVVDPSGDYAWEIFDRIDAQRKGAGDRLRAKATAVMNATAAPATATQSPAAALFAARLIDMSITYCSASRSLEGELPGLTSLAVPASLDPQPVYGIAVLSNKPAALALALLLLSERGQLLVDKNGLIPLVAPAAR